MLRNRLLLTCAAALTLFLPAGNAVAAKTVPQPIKLICLAWQSDVSGGLSCQKDDARYQPQTSVVATTQASSHQWAMVRWQMRGMKPQLCIRHYDRSEYKGDYSGNAGLSCFAQQGAFPWPYGQFSVTGLSIPTKGGDWWLNKVQVQGQRSRYCLTWDSSGAGIYCFFAPGWNFATPTIVGTNINQDWWANRVTIPGSRTQICLTWDAGSTGGIDCFPEEQPFVAGAPTIVPLRLNNEWGINLVRVPGQKPRACLAWEGSGDSGGLYCSAVTGTVALGSVKFKEWKLDHGYEIVRVTIPVGPAS